MPRLRPPSSLLLAGCLLAAGAGRALAGPAVITSRAAIDPATGELIAFMGGIDDSGRSLKATAVEVVPEGERTGLPAVAQPLSDWAALASEHSPTWRPPLVIGLVYLWIDGVPSGVLDGVHAFFQRIPSRTTVLPTVYGRMRQGRASLTAADISRLDEVPHLEPYKPNLVEAIRLDLLDLAATPAPLKILLVVTDGRDFADPKGQGPGDLAALGAEIRKAGVTPLIVGFPPSDVDAPQSAANLRELHDAAGGFLRVLEQSDDLENTLESLGQAVGDVQRVAFPLPLGWRVFGAPRRISLRLTTGNGRHLGADLGKPEVPAGAATWIVGLSLLALVAVVAVVIGVKRRRRSMPPPEEDDVVSAAHALIRRGAPPERAVEELSRAFPDAAEALHDLDEDVLDDPRYPYFRTRLGRARMQEIRDLLAERAADVPHFAPSVAAILASAVSERTEPYAAADTITARTGLAEWTAFASMDQQKLSESLRLIARDHPLLGSPRARSVAAAIQGALRERGSNRRGVVVGWLVRSAGAGRRGETLRIDGGRTTMGAADDCTIRIADDPAVAARHAEIALDGEKFSIRSLGGKVSVEGTPVDGSRVLSDGETIAVGAGLFVFKSVTAGSVVI